MEPLDKVDKVLIQALKNEIQVSPSLSIETRKIDIDGFIRKLRVTNVNNFKTYLKDVFSDLFKRQNQFDKSSNETDKKLTKKTFSNYYQLPEVIGDYLFKAMDKNKDDLLSLSEFGISMIILFYEKYESVINFIFDFYDIDKTGRITKENVKFVLSFIPFLTKPIKGSPKLDKFESKSLPNREKYSKDLKIIVDKTFNNRLELSRKEFIDAIENKCSEVFLFIFIFLLDNKPFSISAIEMHSEKLLLSQKQLSLPKQESIEVNKSGFVKSEDKLLSMAALNEEFAKEIEITTPNFPCLNVNRLPTSKKFMKEDYFKKYGSKNVKSNANNEKLGGGSDFVLNINQTITRIKRKFRKNLNEIDSMNTVSNISNLSPVIDELKFVKAEKINVIKFQKSQSLKPTKDESSVLSFIDLEKSFVLKEGILFKYKHSKNQLTPYYYRLIDKELYFYSNNDISVKKGVYHLDRVFVQEEGKAELDGNVMYLFSIIFNKCQKKYFLAENCVEYLSWIESIRKTIGYSNLNDSYEFLDGVLGKGKYGLVRLALHKKTNGRVAIKVLHKKDMSPPEEADLRSEIEILTFCKHPNIIRIYDVYENPHYIYIVMEYCEGKDLFNYLESKSFKIPIEIAKKILKSLAEAIKYLHDMNIVHRDLKPENIILSKDTEDFDVKLLDFGLSKILKPGEVILDSVGTFSYVAPEVLLNFPHGKEVDIWSLGIVSYLLFTGFLPFDDQLENEIRRKTIELKTPFPNYAWKNVPINCKVFVDKLLEKNPSKRPQIRDILQDPIFRERTQVKFHTIK